MRACTIITGEINCGKTSLLRRILLGRKNRDLRTGGVIGLPIYHDGLKAGYDVMDVRLGGAVPLLRDIDRLDNCGRIDGMRIGRFFLFTGGLEFAGRVLRREGGLTDGIQEAAAAAGELPVDTLCIDELGPLEMKGGGYAPVFHSLLGSFTGELILVSRGESLEWVEDQCSQYGWPVNIEKVRRNI